MLLVNLLATLVIIGNNAVTPIEAVVTAYSPMDNVSGICADFNPSVTSTGTTPQRGTMAVDPARIPYGTQIVIPGYGLAIAEDTGGALRRDKKNTRLDIVQPTYKDAIKWGCKRMTVYIVNLKRS